jgi:hypothetical protein
VNSFRCGGGGGRVVHSGRGRYVGSQGGILIGVSATDVGIVELDTYAIGSAFCGGCIGTESKGRKMCIDPNYTIAKHAENKIDLTDIGYASVLLIRTSNTASKPAVHVEPCLPALSLRPNKERYKSELRSVEAWNTLFRGLIASEDSPSEKAIDLLASRIDGRRLDSKFGVTPLKKRAKLDVLSPALEANYEVTMQEIASQLGEDPQTILSNVALEWKVLVRNLTTLKEMVLGCREVQRKLSTPATTDEFSDVDFKIARLSNLIGSRPDDLGPTTMFQLIQDLATEVADATLRSLPTGLSGADLLKVSGFVQTFNDPKGAGGVLKESVCHDVLARFKPMIEMFSKYSSDKSKPGDLLDIKLANLRAEVNLLSQQIKSGTGGPPLANPAQAAAPSTGVQWNLNSMSLGGPSAPPQAQAGGGTQAAPGSGVTVALLKLLEDRIKDLEERLQDKAVTIGVTTFNSQKFTKAWLAANAGAPGAYIYFMDAHSMLNLAMEDASSNAEVLLFQQSATKSGYGTSEEALVGSSFKIELPVIFGRDWDANRMSADSRVLPAMKVPDSWDPEDGYNGGRHRFEREIKEVKATMLRGAANHMQGIGLLAAIKCISTTYAFLDRLAKWISSQFRDLVGRGGSKEDCWRLISHCVRAIFSDLHAARIAGRGPFMTSDRQLGVVWGCLQAHRVMSEYVDADFASHPRCSHILNLHLQDNALMKTEFNEYRDKTNGIILTLLSRLKTVEGLADTAISAKNAKAGGWGKMRAQSNGLKEGRGP